MRLSLPNQAHCNELDATANLLISYILCIKPVTLEADVDTEITRMTMKGITEPYDDPKGFNSPVFTFYKNNGKICVVTNVKRTVKKMLTYLDLYQQSTWYSTKLAKATNTFYLSTSAIVIGRLSVMSMTMMKLHSLEDLMLSRHSSSIQPNIHQPDIFLMQCRCPGYHHFMGKDIILH